MTAIHWWLMLCHCHAGGFGATAALLHVKANAEEDMRATDLRVAGALAGSVTTICWISGPKHSALLQANMPAA